MERTFELVTIANQGKLEVKDFDKTLADAQSIIEDNPAFIITNDVEKKEAKETRAKYNKLKDAIKDKRIADINSIVGTYDAQCKQLEKLFDNAQKEFGEQIKAYEDKQKVDSVVVETKAKEYTATITFTDEKIVEKLKTFCEKNNLKLTIK